MSETATGVEARVCEDIAARQQLGIAKYGITVEQSADDMLRHAYEESLDLPIYLKAEIERRAAASSCIDGTRLLALLKRARHFSDGMNLAAYEAIQNAISELEPNQPNDHPR